MDLSESIASKSDQMDYQDFLGGERTVTVQEVREGPSPEQPVEVVAVELDRPWRPAKSMRRVLVAAWGADASKYTGRRLVLFGDPTVKWAGAAVGGIRIRAMSHIEKPLSVSLTVTRGKRAPFRVEVLADEAPTPPIPTFATVDEARAHYNRRQSEGATPDELAAIRAAAPTQKEPA